MEFHSSDPLGLVGKTGTSLWCSMNGNAEAFNQHRNCKTCLKKPKTGKSKNLSCHSHLSKTFRMAGLESLLGWFRPVGLMLWHALKSVLSSEWSYPVSFLYNQERSELDYKINGRGKKQNKQTKKKNKENFFIRMKPSPGLQNKTNVRWNTKKKIQGFSQHYSIYLTVVFSTQ